MIAGPEGFQVVDDLLQSEPVNPRQRQNLAIIAKMLQLASSGKSVDAPEAAELNKFLQTANVTLNAFFEKAIKVRSAESFFGIDEYSDVTMLTKPTIFITPREVHNTHRLCLANLDTVAPTPEDPLRVILNDLVELPEEEEVLGDEDHADGEMSMVLTNRFEVPEESDTSMKALLVRTKRRVIDVIRFQEGKTLKEILEKPASAEVEAQHMNHMATIKEKADAQRAAAADGAGAEDGAARKALRRMSKEDGSFMSLAQIKEVITDDLPELMKAGVCKADDGYQGILNSIAEDIRNQTSHRRQRKQELAKLQSAVAELGKKKEYYGSQIQCVALPPSVPHVVVMLRTLVAETRLRVLFPQVLPTVR